MQSNAMNIPVSPTHVLTFLDLLLPAGKKFPVSLYDVQLVLEIIALGFQPIGFRPDLSLLSKNNLFLCFHLSSLALDLCCLVPAGFLPSLGEFLVFPARVCKSMAQTSKVRLRAYR